MRANILARPSMTEAENMDQRCWSHPPVFLQQGHQVLAFWEVQGWEVEVIANLAASSLWGVPLNCFTSEPPENDLAGFWHWQLLAEIRGLCGGESEGSSNDCGSWGWWFPFLLEQKSGVLGERTRKELQSYMNWNSPEWCNDFTLDITITHLLVLGCLSHACNV